MLKSLLKTHLAFVLFRHLQKDDYMLLYRIKYREILDSSATFFVIPSYVPNEVDSALRRSPYGRVRLRKHHPMMFATLRMTQGRRIAARYGYAQSRRGTFATAVSENSLRHLAGSAPPPSTREARRKACSRRVAARCGIGLPQRGRGTACGG